MKNVKVKEVVKFVSSQVRYNVKTAQKGKQSESKMFETQKEHKRSEIGTSWQDLEKASFCEMPFLWKICRALVSFARHTKSF